MHAPVTPPAPSFMSAYMEGHLAEFFELVPGDLAAALAVPRPAAREELVAALSEHARQLGAPPAVFANLERLRHEESRAVVTGQQTGLLLGPTYTLSKAITAVKLAQRLDTDERPVVPLFWLATQDHDAHEIDHTYVLDEEETLHRLAVPVADGVAVGHAALTPEMLQAVMRGLDGLTPKPRFLGEVSGLLQEAAASVGTFSDWFAAILTRLLGEQGLVIVDPLRRPVAGLFAHVLAAEIAEPERTASAINAAGARLKAIGYEPQLGRGADATNLFVEVGGRRQLLRHRGTHLEAGDTTFSRESLLALLAEDPTRVTPAAGLRPVVQDALLPTAVFVLGPGELKYVAQLRDVYRFHGVPMPLAWPRASATVLEPVADRLLRKFATTATEFRADPLALRERVLLETHGHAERFAAAATTVEREFDELLRAVAGIDPTLAGTVRRGEQHLQSTLNRLRRKASTALAREDGTTRRQFERLEAHLLPLGNSAERILSPFSHMLKFGVEPVLARFLEMEPSGEQVLRI